ncbi:MAG: hydroxyisourate hydrolase [Sandaracinus sp.]|nr:hydroxyisourate hydrolase [Myxococcales bacterium]MCB9614892.1 hydroxyisourate hydrolase [Sandaracinus sp.]MCB9618644.1 hydroxyisourate hydrolase [Sandaracinus sp.]MCB9632577.1 hydroxyisourate hydrolase [Sandaracinus sp.]
MSLSTHVLDLASGLPAAGVRVVVETQRDGLWCTLGEHRTDDDGRVKTLLPDGETLRATLYRLTFDTAGHLGADAFFPEATLTFRVADPKRHHHVPLLLSPYGYSTYRGS